VHPFGMNVSTTALDAMALSDWQAAEQAETADEELPHGPDDFELSIRVWLGYVKAPFRPFVYAWVAAISRLARVPVSASTLKKLRGMMRNDVDESAGILWDAKPAVIAAWCAWYPEFVEQQIAERANSDPWFLLSAEEFYQMKRAQQSRDDAAKKQRERDLKLAKALFDHAIENGGLVHWRPGLLAQALTGRTDKRGGKRTDADAISAMGAAMVRLDVAEWCLRENGKPWALRLTASALERVGAGT
jgi:hypothetical protein